MNTNFSIKEFLLGRPKSTFGQLIKYGFFGGIGAAAFFLGTFALQWIFPAYVDHTVLPPEVVAKNTNLFNTISFIPSSVIAYLTNRFFVFSPGRHNVWVEAAIFALISALSYIGGSIGNTWIIETFRTTSAIGTFSFAICSALVNFVCRKFIVFKT